ncbi:MAG: endo alpha-1,4 polygalactosaminidase, partial [Planctomycetales bacterium]
DRNGQGAPSFLLQENPEWKGNYKVKYWKPAWQAIVLNNLDEILEQGFDGAWLDLVDAFEHFEEDDGKWIDHRRNPETGRSYRADMDAWVKRLAKHARTKRPDFLIVPQNGFQLLEDKEYAELIDAAAVEDLFTNGRRRQPVKEQRYVLSFLKKLPAGKPTLAIEYGRKPDVRRYSIEQAAQHGFTLLLTDRNLKTLGGQTAE